jgi:alkylhydroperoxidase/carboxymuconolactone decarboxylase family protein YurZ
MTERNVDFFMDRIEQSKQKYAELFGNTDVSASGTDPDFADILNHFVYGDVYYHGSLNDKQRELVTLVVLAANHTLTQLRVHVGAALNVGLTPVEVKEAIYHCAPYIGFPKTLDALDQANKVFAQGVPVGFLLWRDLFQKRPGYQNTRIVDVVYYQHFGRLLCLSKHVGLMYNHSKPARRFAKPGRSLGASCGTSLHRCETA